MNANLLLKSKMTPEQLVLLQGEFDKKKKSKTLAYILWFFLGVLGAHRFYAGDTIRAIFMLITLGGIGIWTLIDVFFIGSRIEQKNNIIEAQIMADIQKLEKPMGN